MKVIILGAGLVGAPMAFDLIKEKKFEVSVADIDETALDQIKQKQPQIAVLKKDLSKPDDVYRLVSNYDLVINAVPGFMGFETAKAIIKAGKNCSCCSPRQISPGASPCLVTILASAAIRCLA